LLSATIPICASESQLHTSPLSTPVTNRFKSAFKAFCRIKLLIDTPKTMPKLRQRISVLVITAWSSWVLVASTAIEEAGKESPCPMLGGQRNRVASQVGILSHITDRQMAPTNIASDPMTISSFMRPVADMMKPAETAQMVRATEGPPSLNPDCEGVSSFTAWKYNGALKMMVLMPIWARKLLKTMLARGWLESICMGMTGLLALSSTRMSIAPDTTATTREEMMRGWSQG
jgi:hypothetical protein